MNHEPLIGHSNVAGEAPLEKEGGKITYIEAEDDPYSTTEASRSRVFVMLITWRSG